MTQTTKPTGGKWYYHNENNEEYFDIESNGNRICSIVAHDEEAEDNARAICESVNACYGNGINPESVPMMLEALKAIASQSKMCEAADLIEIAQAAINAADDLKKIYEQAQAAINAAQQ